MKSAAFLDVFSCRVWEVIADRANQALIFIIVFLFNLLPCLISFRFSQLHIIIINQYFVISSFARNLLEEAGDYKVL